MFFGQKIHPLNFDIPEQLAIIQNGVRLTGPGMQGQVFGAVPFPGAMRLRFIPGQQTEVRQCSEAVVPELREGLLLTPHPIAFLDNGAPDRIAWTTATLRVELSPAQLRIEAAGMGVETSPQGIGVCGDSLLLNFALHGIDGAYGFGERTRRLNKLGDSCEMLTIDVVAVFRHTYSRDDYDPTYVAIPLAILKAGERFLGLFFDNPGHAVCDLGKSKPGEFWYESFAGITDLYLLAGPTLPEVVRRYATLTGRAPLLPLWALGYHQCRWSYRNADEFRQIAAQCAAADLPVSALWYDIDYMDNFRLFTWNRDAFPDPAGLNRELQAAGIHTVTIIDPGVKREPGYAVYESGRQRRVFCQTASGREYVGKVWPGDTVFPDFTQEDTRAWWADWLANFLRESAVDGVWLDMNDPATGYSRPEEMRFAGGTIPHDRYHNQYAHFMAMASRAALEQNDPEGRPFLLTRSAWAGTQRYSAVWTGDNASNWKHLRMALPCSLNLSLSGVAFNGPDVGGFMDDATAELLVRWHQACCLFPFFRNHASRHSRRQEPWQFGTEALTAIRGAIHTRYRMLPYLYQCFFTHWREGDPIIRPLLYHYPNPEYTDLDDQYLVGDALLVAPILHGEGHGPEVFRQGIKQYERMIHLPAGAWFDLNRGEWQDGGRLIHYAAALDEVPLFVRDGAILPYYAGSLANSFMDLNAIELHIFSRERTAAATYFLDDQKSRNYERGVYGVATIAALVEGQRLHVELTEAGDYPPETVRFTPVIYGRPEVQAVRLTVNGRQELRPLRPSSRPWFCRTIAVNA